MKKSIYYNDNDRHAVAALKALMAEGYISGGDVDDRSIEDVRAEDLTGYTTCHFFAGQGGWALALRLAAWPEDRPVWTASLPCQPFSSAGKRNGVADERHLWPVFSKLVRECRPGTIFGEQVASAAALAWWDGVSTDLEAADYACAAVDLCAASVGAPHIRQRLFWLAEGLEYPNSGGTKPIAGSDCEAGQEATRRTRPDNRSVISDRTVPAGGLADADGGKPGDGELQRGGEHRQQPEDGGPSGRLADANARRCTEVNTVPRRAATGPGVSEPLGRLGDAGCERLEGGSHDPRRQQSLATQESASGFWADSILIPCRDGKARRIPTQPEPERVLQRLVDGLPDSLGDMLPESGFPLAGKIKGRPAMLRLLGNSIVPQVAAAFVKAYMDAQAGGTRD